MPEEEEEEEELWKNAMKTPGGRYILHGAFSVSFSFQRTMFFLRFTLINARNY